MSAFRYRAVSPAGIDAAGLLDAADRDAALDQLLGLGLLPIEVDAVTGGGPARRVSAASRRAAAKAAAEIGVLLDAGLPIDRALGLALENVERVEVRAGLADALREVREGRTLSVALGQAEALFPPMARAMIEAGEANGRLGEAIIRLAEAMERREELRATIIGASVYPVALVVIACGVVLMMLLFVIPQFETVFAAEPQARLPATTLAVLAASRFVRHYGLALLLLAVLAGIAGTRLARTDKARAALDRFILRVPQLGTIVRYAQTAGLARTLGVLVGGGVDLPVALAMAQRSLTNRPIAEAVGAAVVTLRGGGGLTAPLAATGMLPPLAIGFLRTGEETSRLAPMLDRLADVLEREVRIRIERLIAVLTPAVTVLLGGMVATVIASIMTAILGFNDLALG